MDMISKILKLLEDRDMSQGELESLAGLTPNRISKWKSGTGEPTASQAGSIARVLDVPIDYLVYDEAAIPARESDDLATRILWLAQEIGYRAAIKRLTMAPDVLSDVPTVAERKKEKPPSDGRSGGGRKHGA